MISHEHRWAWAAINKTATTSIASILSKRCETGGLKDKHQSMAEIQEVLTPGQFDDYFKFSFVRDPWDRIASLYFYRTRRSRNIEKSFERWLQHQWKLIRRGMADKYILAQTEWLKGRDGKIVVDFVGRFENLDNDWGKICDNIGIRTIQLPMKKVGKKHGSVYRDFYTDRSLKIHKKMYGEDIDYLGYTF
jgi:hypothetical protein